MEKIQGFQEFCLIYIECQHSVPAQKVVSPIFSKAGIRGMMVDEADGQVVRPIYIQETRVHIFNAQRRSFPDFNHTVVAMTGCYGK